MKYILDVQQGSDSYYTINGNISSLLSNRRLVVSLKRLNFFNNDQLIKIPFDEHSEISILQELQTLFKKFSLKVELTSRIQIQVSNFVREEELFQEFSEKAQRIRNNEFDEYPELVKDFQDFQITVGKKLKRKLYPLQLLSAFHMSFAQNACNFAVPGAGKTSIVYGAYAYLKSLPDDDSRHVDKLMVIGPLSSFAPWENEYYECFGHSTSFKRLSGSSDIKRDEKLQHLYSGEPSEVTLIYHGGVHSLEQDILDFLKRNKTMIVVDEAHRIKNHEGTWGRSVTNISREAIARTILTGTPVPNGYQDIYNLIKFIYPYKFKDILEFHYQNLIEMTNDSQFQTDKIEQLKENLSPFFIRIKKEDLKLPPTEEINIRVKMGPYQREIYDFIEGLYLEEFKIGSSDSAVKNYLNRAKLIRLRQAASNPSLLAETLSSSMEENFTSGDYDPNSLYSDYDEFVDDSEYFKKIKEYEKKEIPAKFLEVHKIIKNIVPNGQKAIIWTIFIQNSKQLQTFLLSQGFEAKLLIGEIPQEQRENVISKFNDPNNLEFSIVIANPFSVAESISLHKGCHYAIYLERDYNCSNFLQSKDRIHRVGLSKNQITTYYYLISEDSIDEVIDDRLQQKIIRMEEIINDDIPLFKSIDEDDETSIIKDLLKNYANRA